MSGETRQSVVSPLSSFEQIRRHLLVEYDPYWIHGFARMLDAEFSDHFGERVSVLFNRGYIIRQAHDTATLGNWPIRTISPKLELFSREGGFMGVGAYRRFGVLITEQTTDKGLAVSIPEIGLVYSNGDPENDGFILTAADETYDVFCPIPEIEPDSLRLLQSQL